MEFSLMFANNFFATARERYMIKLRREAGEPRPWTKDKIFDEWRFTNVHREDDRTTKWLRENIRGPLSDIAKADPTLENLVKVTQAVLIFRWFNRIETGQIILDLIVGSWDKAEARRRLFNVEPVVTGAYIIKAGDGVSKLDGILDCIEGAIPKLPGIVGKKHPSLQSFWADLKNIYFMGPFMAYEVVTDLRWTPVLDQAYDIMTWGNLGPGAIRGIGRVVCDDPQLFNNSAIQQKQMLALMAKLLEMSRDPQYWPQEWPAWEMHEVEMWLCEFAKYCNAVDGDRLKRRYR